MHAQWLNRVRLFLAPWTVVCQAPLSMGFSRQEYWSGVPLPSPLEMLATIYYLRKIGLVKICKEASQDSSCPWAFSPHQVR